MTILILANYANGLFLFRKELVESFKNAGHKVVISVPFDENVHKLSDMGVELVDTHLERHGMNPLKDLKLFASYMKIMKKIRPDVVLTYTIKPNIYGASAAKFLRIPYICNVTGLGTAIEGGGLLSKILVMMYSFSMNRAKKVFFQNERNLEFMKKKGVATKNAALLPGSGVNLTEHPFREYPSEEDGIRFLAVIRIMKDKGIEEYLKAAEIISSEYKNVSFDLVGEYEEDEREKYEPMIHALEEKGTVKYYGHLDSVEPSMAKSHIIVHPSYHEGLSNVLLEAGACGRPVLASDINGCKETFEEGATGIGFKPGDVSALSDAIRKILALSENDRKEMGRKARIFIEKNFDRQIVTSIYEQTLKNL
ncbi:MAG: glycosyltransferase family 4 protein [Butyrivibrio sp.]|nr:glycosyltransferase family 4 protein [Butyrivibrio sp.]